MLQFCFVRWPVVLALLSMPSAAARRSAEAWYALLGCLCRKQSPLIEKVCITLWPSNNYIQFRKQPPVLVARGVSDFWYLLRLLYSFAKVRFVQFHPAWPDSVPELGLAHRWPQNSVKAVFPIFLVNLAGKLGFWFWAQDLIGAFTIHRWCFRWRPTCWANSCINFRIQGWNNPILRPYGLVRALVARMVWVHFTSRYSTLFWAFDL